MNILTLDSIEKSYSERKLFDGASFYLQEGEKVGIIGINGTGKTTLLKIMAGEEETEGGQVVVANHVVIRFLHQQPVFAEGQTVLQAALAGNVGEHSDVWSLEAEARQLLADIGITDYDADVATLSGGGRKRVAIANTLLSSADILILDEPTNHLDADASEWLENYLKHYKGALVLVTHDRYFLDSVTNRIVEIDHGKFYSYDSNYSGFLELKAEREEMEDSTEKKRQNILRNELEWVRRGAQARTTKQKARLQRYEELKNRRAPVRDSQMELSSISTRMGRTTIELEHVSKAYGDKVLLEDFTYYFLKGDRIGFIGPNGCGKTTLMKMIVGMTAPDAGTIEIGQTVKIGYYSQEFENTPAAGVAYMNPDLKVIDYIRETAEFVRTKEGLVSASTMLDRFLFPPEEQYARIGKLSGGEKKRLNLLRVLMEAPNVLILDEPTNDLDIRTLTILEDYLDAFDGIVIVVSHDRYFLDRIVRRMFIFEGEGRLRQFESGYSDYMLVKSVEAELAAESAAGGSRGTAAGSGSTGGSGAEGTDSRDGEQPKPKRTNTHEQKVRFTYAEQKDWETIEDQIAKLEAKIADCEKQIGQNATNFTKLNELMQEKDAAEQQLEERMDRWMYLTEKYEQMQ